MSQTGASLQVRPRRRHIEGPKTGSKHVAIVMLGCQVNLPLHDSCVYIKQIMLSHALYARLLNRSMLRASSQRRGFAASQ